MKNIGNTLAKTFVLVAAGLTGAENAKADCKVIPSTDGSYVTDYWKVMSINNPFNSDENTVFYEGTGGRTSLYLGVGVSEPATCALVYTYTTMSGMDFSGSSFFTPIQEDIERTRVFYSPTAEIWRFDDTLKSRLSQGLFSNPPVYEFDYGTEYPAIVFPTLWGVGASQNGPVVGGAAAVYYVTSYLDTDPLFPAPSGFMDFSLAGKASSNPSLMAKINSDLASSIANSNLKVSAVPHEIPAEFKEAAAHASRSITLDWNTAGNGIYEITPEISVRGKKVANANYAKITRDGSGAFSITPVVLDLDTKKFVPGQYTLDPHTKKTVITPPVETVMYKTGQAFMVDHGKQTVTETSFPSVLTTARTSHPMSMMSTLESEPAPVQTVNETPIVTVPSHYSRTATPPQSATRPPANLLSPEAAAVLAK